MFKQVTLTNKCLAIVMQRQQEAQDKHRSNKSANPNSTPENGFRIFQDFLDENRASFWNPGLVQSVNALEFVGFVRPGTLFVCGNEIHLECLRGAWARRVLKPPVGFSIKRLGDIGGIEMQEVPQTQFIPLPEVLCLIVSNLNRSGEPATLTRIISCLSEEYDGMCIPKQEVLYATLGALIAEGKLYCMGDHYFIPTPTMFQYYQQQFLRRNAAQQPASYLWTKEQVQKPQETCSRECQTGASIVSGQPPYVPNKRDQATSVQTQISVQTSCNANNGRSSGQCKKEKPINGDKENKGFLSRLFGRNKPKSMDTCQKTISNREADQNSNSNHLSSNIGPSTSVPGSQFHESTTPCNIPVATFSAQFPPPEWLCDPRFVKNGQKESQYSQPQQAFLAKIRRTGKEQQNLQPTSARDQRNSVWVDPILDGHGGKIQNIRRDRNDQKRFASQRQHDVIRHGHLSPNDVSDRHQRSRRHRLSKYLSSSSECVRDQSPYQNQKKSSMDEKKKKHQHYSVYQFPAHQLDEHQHAQDLDDPNATPKATDLDEKSKSTLERCPKPTAIVMVGRIPPLALPADPEFEHDTVSECGHRTSTPTPKKSTRPTALETTIDDPQQEPRPENPLNGQRDSAYSASPVVTESSSDGKYSSWSGSDAQNGTVAAANSPESVEEKLRNMQDNTYVNDTQSRRCALDHTYENLDHANATKYENIDDHDEKNPRLHAYVSSV